MDVSAAHLPFCQEFLQLFCHPLGEGGDQHALVLLGAQLYFLHQVVYLVLGRTHVYRRVQQAGGAHHLFHYQALALLQFVVARSRADEDPLSQDMLELVEFQGPVVRSGREAEAVFDQHLLARAVASVHGPHLRKGDVALVDEGDEVLRKIVYEAEWPLSCAPPVEVPGIILDAGAVAQFLDHLHVVFDPLLEAVSLMLLSDGTEILALLHHVVLYHPDGLGSALLGGDEDIGRVYDDLLGAFNGHACKRVYQLQFLDGVSEKYYAAAGIGVSQVDVYRIALYPEGSPLEVHVVAVVKGVHEAVQELVAADAHSAAEYDGVVVEVLRIADAVEAGDGGYHYHVAAAREQGGGGGEAQFLYLIVDAQVFLDVGVGHRQVGLGLVVVVVGNEILHGIVREK